jgi:hypothetical protein
MNLTKNQIYIISSVIIIAVIYFMFFRKKTTSSTANKMAMPPAGTQTDPNPGESGYYGSQFGWNDGTNPLYTSFDQAMGSVDGNESNSVAGMMESNYKANALYPKYTNKDAPLHSNYAANDVNESNYNINHPWTFPLPGTDNPSKNWETN